MFQKIRSMLFWLHLGIGVVTALVALMLCVTGALLALELPITQWADSQLVEAPSGAQGPPSTEALALKVAQAQPRVPEQITVGRAINEPAVVSFGRRDQVYFDPWRGESLGAGAKGVHDVFRALMTFHRWFSLEGAARDVGRTIVGLSTLGFVVLTLTGIVLWLPRRWRRQNVRAVIWFRRGLKGKARDFNWHHVFGIWSVLPLVFFAVTGAAIAYPWLNQGLQSLAGAEQKQQQKPRAGAGAQRQGEGRAQAPQDKPEAAAAWVSRLTGVDAALERAAKEAPDWRRLSVSVPATSEAPFVIVADSGNGRQPQHRVELTIERQSLAVSKRKGWAQSDTSQQVRGFIRFGHTGEYGGWLGQLIAVLASVAGAVLSVTGVLLSWRRFGQWRKRRARQATVAASDVVGVEDQPLS